MPLHHLRTSFSARLLLVYSVVFLSSSLVLLGVVYWAAIYDLRAEVNETLMLRTESIVSEYEQHGRKGVIDLIDELLDEKSAQEQVYLFVDRNHEVLAGNADAWSEPALLPGDLQSFTMALHSDESPVRLRGNVRKIGPYMLLVGDRLLLEKQMQKTTAFAILGGVIVSFALAVIGSGIVIRSINHRIEVIRRMAERIASGELSARIPTGDRRDEFDYLADILNRMLSRIETLMQDLRHISDNIAHDLRTPLNRLRARLEDSLRDAKDANMQQTLQRSVDDVNQLIGIFNSILKISDIRTQRARRDFGWVDMGPLLVDIVDLYQPLAEDRQLTLHLHLTGGHLVWGERGLLGQAVANLLDNAIKFSKPGGEVEICFDEESVLTVADHGSGIPDKYKDKVTDRFYRLEKNLDMPGHGLGLSMVNAIAELHDARLRFADNAPGVRVSLEFFNVKKI